jgi:hypothetical protein
MPGVGPNSIRALSLPSDIPFTVEVSTREPASVSFARAAKRRFPHPVEHVTYNHSIGTVCTASEQAKLG